MTDATTAFAAALAEQHARTLERPSRLLQTLDGHQWFVFQRETYEVEDKGRFHWRAVARWRVFDVERHRIVGPRRWFRRRAQRDADRLNRCGGYHPILGPVPAAVALEAIGLQGPPDPPPLIRGQLLRTDEMLRRPT